MQEGSGVLNLQTELNYHDSFKSYCNSSDLGFLSSGGRGRWVGGCLGWSAIVYMSSGMFWGKESSNRIELSRLVQELLKFGVLGSLRLWGGGRWVGGIWGHGGCPHMHAHAHAHTHTHTHTCIELQMAASMEASMFSMFSMFNMHVHACVCVCMRACMGHPPHTHTYPHPHPPICHPPRGCTPGIT